MAFGSPRPGVTLINLAITASGFGLASASTGLLRWAGVAIALFGLVVGTMMGSWGQFLPGSRPVGKREDDL